MRQFVRARAGLHSSGTRPPALRNPAHAASLFYDSGRSLARGSGHIADFDDLLPTEDSVGVFRVLYLRQVRGEFCDTRRSECGISSGT
jgi:hypothetical protein